LNSPPPGAFVQPTILTDLNPEILRIMKKYLVLWLSTVIDEEAAITLTNDSSFGLGCSIFTQDIERGKRIADKIDTGMVLISQPPPKLICLWRN
jgi:succinate-semialdehyde dehydrogenase/glutarate-semialdehyde dehydrogenase